MPWKNYQTFINKLKKKVYCSDNYICSYFSMRRHLFSKKIIFFALNNIERQICRILNYNLQTFLKNDCDNIGKLKYRGQKIKKLLS